MLFVDLAIVFSCLCVRIFLSLNCLPCIDWSVVIKSPYFLLPRLILKRFAILSKAGTCAMADVQVCLSKGLRAQSC